MNNHLWLTLDGIRAEHGHRPEVAWLLGQVEALQRVNEHQASEWEKAVADKRRLTARCRELRDECDELRRRLGDVGP